MDRDDKALRRIISQLTGEWQSQAEEAADALFELLKKGKPLAVALRIIKEQYAELFTIPHLQDALVESACAGFGVSVSSLDKQTIAKVGHTLSESWTGDELITLSQRIRGMGEEMSRTIVDTISAQMRANQSWIEASRALYDGYDGGHLLEQADIPEYLKKVRRATQGSPEALKEARKALGNIDRLSRNGAPTKALKAAYSELVDSALIGTEEQMEKAVHTAMEEKSRYIADRIIRTENARAWADGFIARADADEDCIGYEWVMDTRHPVIDICDFHSQVDAFGMGPGKFPKGKAPAMPAHPHCLCRFVEVYRSKNQPKDQRAKAGREWLEELSEADRKRVLGKQGAEAFDKGKDWVKSSKNLKLGKQESRLSKSLTNAIMGKSHLTSLPSNYDIPPMNAEQFYRMKNALEKMGVVIIQDEDGDNYLQFIGAEAVTFGDGKTIIFKSGRPPSASAMFEEVIHSTQLRKLEEPLVIGDPETQLLRLQLEIEANEKLLRNKDVYGFTELDTKTIKINLQKYYDKLAELKEVQNGF